MPPTTDLLVQPPFSDSPDALDLRDADHLERVTAMAETLLDAAAGVADLESAEQAAAPLSARVAVKLALSRLRLLELPPQQISVLFAVYKEHERMLPPEAHPHGEDFLRRKMRQLDWLVDGTQHAWDLTVVDDGCPAGSGAQARAIFEEERAGDRGRVLFLAEAIAAGHPLAANMKDASASQKGGSILYGMYEAALQSYDRPHSILFTDADLSTHLGQCGSLVAALHAGADAAIGSRRESASVVVKKGKRNTRGKLFIYLWKRLLPPLRYITDTQCGFKAFRAELVSDVVSRTEERRFAFDIELLLLSELRRHGSITKVPVAWIDSEAASTTTDIGPYLSMLRSVVGTYRRMLPSDAESDAFAELIMRLDEAAWQRLVSNTPDAIAEADPQAFGDAAEVDAATLAAAAGL